MSTLPVKTEEVETLSTSGKILPTGDTKEAVLNRLIGARVRDLRTQHEDRRENLAHLLDVTPPQITHYEKGVTTIPATYLFRIAVRYDVPMDYFYAAAGKYSDDDINSFREVAAEKKSDVAKAFSPETFKSNDKYLALKAFVENMAGLYGETPVKHNAND